MSGMSGRSQTPVDPPDVGGRWSPRRWLAWLVLLPVYLWRATGPLRQPRCRFHPTCSTYAVEAVRSHGSLRGSVLAARRLGRCHPWNAGGVDFVPQAPRRDAARR